MTDPNKKMRTASIMKRLSDLADRTNGSDVIK